MHCMSENLQLILPTAERKDEFITMAGEFHDAGETDWPHHARAGDPIALDDFQAFLDRCESLRTGQNMPEGFVPSTEYWLIAHGRLVGTASLRHTLNEFLTYEGGHIGYCIRPSQRGKGYMSGFMKLLLDEAARLGIAEVLMTCLASNLPSQRIIEKLGGVLEDERPSRRAPGAHLRRYWIDNTSRLTDA
jgi:predicted acetyltransferase